jgi:two-component system response regulator CpxR
MPDILIIDDDRELFALLEDYLKDEGFFCAYAPEPEEGIQMVAATSYDALVLDVMLPGLNGFEVLRLIRADEKNAALPVIMLTAKGEEIDRVVGLEMGADDYLGKPFSARELVARIRAVLRRTAPVKSGVPAAQQVQMEDITIIPSSLCIISRDTQKEISVSELRLLTHLVQNVGQVVSRDFLYKTIFGHQAYPMDRSLDMLVSRLRRKLGPRTDGGERIKAIRGEGYMYLLAGDSRA